MVITMRRHGEIDDMIIISMTMHSATQAHSAEHKQMSHSFLVIRRHSGKTLLINRQLDRTLLVKWLCVRRLLNRCAANNGITNETIF